MDRKWEPRRLSDAQSVDTTDLTRSVRQASHDRPDRPHEFGPIDCREAYCLRERMYRQGDSMVDEDTKITETAEVNPL